MVYPFRRRSVINISTSQRDRYQLNGPNFKVKHFFLVIPNYFITTPKGSIYTKN